MQATFQRQLTYLSWKGRNSFKQKESLLFCFEPFFVSFRWIFLVTKSTNFVVLRAEGPVGVSRVSRVGLGRRRVLRDREQPLGFLVSARLVRLG